MIRRLASVLSVFFLLCGLFYEGAWADQSKPSPKGAAAEEDIYELQKMLVDALDQVERNYVRDVSRRELVEAAIRGILDELDPYSSYISREDMKQFRTSVESQFGGIGIQISLDGGQLKVLSPLVGTPAYRAGVTAGDRIVEIDGEGTSGITLDEAVRRLKGPAGTKVKLTIIHSGRSSKDVIDITREVIRVHTVLGDHRKADDAWDFMLDNDQRIGYIRITAFSRGTAGELRKALSELKNEKLAGLILDLRFNPGGLLSSAIEVSDMFVAGGRIVSTEGRNSLKRTWDAHRKGTFEGFPMVVLVNRYSASASEIVAACLQDHDRAVVIGERTWGKGSVQNVIEMENHRSALKLTTASYRRPSGKNIHRFPKSKDDDEWGVMPNDGYRMRLTDRELLALVGERRRRDIVEPKEPDSSDSAEHAVQSPDSAEDDKPAAAEPTAGDEDDSPATPDEEPSEGPEKPSEGPEEPSEGPEKPGVVDPHLRIALDYLTGELARAE